MKARMNVYLTTGKKNYKYAYVAIRSLFENNQSSEIYLYIVSEDLEETDLTNEIALAEQYGNHIIILPFNEEVASKHIQVHADDHWPIGTMSSYWLFHELLPEDVDRIIVIESDTVIVGDISEIYNTEFDDCYVICPGAEHKPKNHRESMAGIGAECLTFVLSVYNVDKIRKDFTITDILDKDEIIKKFAGNSQMEYTFGLLFAGKIKYVPGKISCIDENERYIQELGYDYIVECEKTAKIIHFSSYKDYSKPWNPVFLVPGYRIWWEYAKKSPYYKEYFERQWQIYDATRKKNKLIAQNITYRNLLICAMGIMTILLMAISLMGNGGWQGCLVILGSAILSIAGAYLVRKISIVIENRKFREDK
ncbi:MAG: glycosyltransferase [Lachnospiraceae bacterium]|nr:glycosyltransferase [Lachnospiraceae bacterium]